MSKSLKLSLPFHIGLICVSWFLIALLFPLWWFLLFQLGSNSLCPFRNRVLHFIIFIMDRAQSREFHHHLARAIMHLNCLAGFLPLFEPAIEWDDPMGDPDTRTAEEPSYFCSSPVLLIRINHGIS